MSYHWWKSLKKMKHYWSFLSETKMIKCLLILVYSHMTCAIITLMTLYFVFICSVCNILHRKQPKHWFYKYYLLNLVLYRYINILIMKDYKYIKKDFMFIYKPTCPIIIFSILVCSNHVASWSQLWKMSLFKPTLS